MITYYNTIGIVHTTPLNIKKIVVDKTDLKYGVIDFETYFQANDKYPNGEIAVPYAIGVYIDDKYKEIAYIDDGIADDCSIGMFTKILDMVKDSGVKLLFAHNATGFDNILMADIGCRMQKAGVPIELK